MSDIFNINSITSDTVKKSGVRKNTTAEHSKRSKKPKKERNIQKLAIQFISNPDEHNFGLLCERINWGLRSYIYKIVKNDEITAEVITKTFENIYFKRDQFNPEIAQFSTWMYRIARNNALKYIQSNHNDNLHIGIDFEELYDSTVGADCDQSTTANSFTVSDNFHIVYADGEYVTYDKEKILSDLYDASISCLDYLPDNLRVVMKERLLKEKKIDDIATDNNIPVSSVKNWLRRGKSELQNIIKNKYPDLYDMYTESGYSV